MPRQPTGKPNGRPRATTAAPTKAAEKSREWRLKNPQQSRAYGIWYHHKNKNRETT